MKLSSVPTSLPKNIMVKKFLPQQSILAHPKTKLFFTHVGNNGLLEAIHYRVPMVGLPIYMNQGNNSSNFDQTDGNSFCSINLSFNEELHVVSMYPLQVVRRSGWPSV
jgi:hypothetical protein